MPQDRRCRRSLKSRLVLRRSHPTIRLDLGRGSFVISPLSPQSDGSAGPAAYSVDLKKENLTNSFSAYDVLKIMAEQNICEDASSGEMTLEKTGLSQAKKQVLPPQNGGSKSAGRCGVNGNRFCPMEWPTSILGDVKQLRIPWWETQTSVPPPPPPQKAPGCSSFCPGGVPCSDLGLGYPVTCSHKLRSPAASSRTLGLIAVSASCPRVFAADLAWI